MDVQLRNAKGETEEEFLKNYDPNRYPCPAVTVDIIVFQKQGNRLKVLLVKRKNHPYIGNWAFPGGFLDIDEDIKDAAYRELKEETSVEVHQVELHQLHTYGSIHRDPRMRVISIAYIAIVHQDIPVKAMDDAEDAAWFYITMNQQQLTLNHDDINLRFIKTDDGFQKMSDSLSLAFDHLNILSDALQYLKDNNLIK